MTISERKREAIARAALTLFASDGYERTSIDAIAAEAGVSKRTVYSHYGDKENLFLSVVRDTYDVMLDRITEIVDRIAWDGDLRVALTSCVTEVTRSIVLAPERLLLPDEQAVAVLRLVDGVRDADAIIDQLGREYQAPREVIASDVLAMLQDLVDKKVLRQ